MSRFTFSTERDLRVFVACLAVALAAFLLLVGLGVNSLPFSPQAAFSDAVTSHWPSAVFLRRAVLDEGTWPLWRPLLMSGQPFAANPLNKVWYPPQWLVFLLPPALHLNVMAWLHLAVAGAGAFIWGRVTGLRPLAAALVGAAYAFAPRLVAALGAGHLDLVYAAGWVPWLLWAVVRTVAPSQGGRWPWLGIFAALCVLADVRLGLYALALTGGYALWELVRVQDSAAKRRASVRLLLAGMLATALTAFQWVPLLLYRDDLSRGAMSLNDAALHSLAPGQWFGLLIGQHGGAGWETFVYVGVSTLALAAAAVVMRPRQFGFWIAALLLIALYAMGDHFVLWSLLNRLVPPLRWWRVPPRVWLLAALILPYLAAWGAQLLATSPPDRRAARLAAVGLLGGGAACAAFTSLLLRDHFDWAPAVGISGLPLTALVVVLALTRQLPPRTIMALFAVVVLADLLWIDHTLVEGRPAREWLTPHQAVAEHLRASGAVRVYSPTYSLPQQAAAYWDIAQFGGIDPFQMTAYVAAAADATGVGARRYSVTLPPFELTADAGETARSEVERLATANRDAQPDPELLGQWLVTHVVAAYPLDTPGLQFDTQIAGTYIYRNLRAPNVRLEWDSPNRVQVIADEAVAGPLYAVAAGRWGAVDNTVGLPGDAATRGQSWTFNYDPYEVWLSAGAFVLGLLATYVVWRGVSHD